jgi:SAM-dependent methyltransferase
VFSEEKRRPAGALNELGAPAPHKDLRAFSLGDLSKELLARLARGDTYEGDADLVLAGQLQDLLGSRLDVHLNRFARRRFYDVVRPILDRVSVTDLAGAVVVDLGSGSLNPLVFGFVFLMLGVERAYSIDLEPIQNAERAVRALATAAGWLLVDGSAVAGEHAIPPTAVLEHLRGFDLAKLSDGDAAGIAPDRLVHKIESVYDLSLGDGEADLVSSVSLLEHLDRIDDALASLRRITKPGGVGHHIVDFVDHRIYGGEVSSPFAFLEIDSAEPLVHGSNRIRCDQMCALFERHGFTVEEVEPCRVDPLSDDEQRRFAEPFRSMRRDDLTMLCARIVVRRR